MEIQQASQSKHVEVGGEKSQRPAVSPVTRLKVSRQNFEDCKGESSKVIEQVLHYLDTERPNDFQCKYRNFEVMYVHINDSLSSIQNATRFVNTHTHTHTSGSRYDLAEDIYMMRLEAENERQKKRQNSFHSSHWYSSLESVPDIHVFMYDN